MNIARHFVRWGALFGSCSAYVYSLFLPALLFEHHESLSGGHVLAWGWWGILLLEFGGLANIAFFVAIVGYIANFKRISLLATVLSLILGLTSFHAKAWWFNEGSGTPIVHLGPAFYVWILSFVTLLLGRILQTSRTEWRSMWVRRK